MPMTLELNIMIGEVISLLVFSIIRCIIHYKKYKNGQIDKSLSRFYIGWYIIANIILIGTFTFSFPSYTFVTDTKFVWQTTIFICLMMVSVGYSILLKMEDRLQKGKHVATVPSIFLFIITLLGIIATFVFTCCIIVQSVIV